MTRLLVLPAVLFAAVILLTGIGLFGNAPGALLAAVMCGSPLFCVTLGYAVGRASNEFTVVRKSRSGEYVPNARVRRPERVEPLS